MIVHRQTVEGQTGTGNILTTPVDFIEDMQEAQIKNFLLNVKTPTSGGVPGAGESMQATVTIHAVEG